MATKGTPRRDQHPSPWRPPGATRQAQTSLVRTTADPPTQHVLGAAAGTMAPHSELGWVGTDGMASSQSVPAAKRKPKPALLRRHLHSPDTRIRKYLISGNPPNCRTKQESTVSQVMRSAANQLNGFIRTSIPEEYDLMSFWHTFCLS